MRIIKSPKKFQQTMMRLRSKQKSIGFVPTMGALHEGHLSLVKKARSENDIVTVSIFVNPTQFGPNEDLKKYPRNLKKDCEKLRREKVDYIFAPTAQSIYPRCHSTYVDLETSKKGRDLTSKLCGRFRPGHFRGVTTVVAKLFNLANPDRVYFGQKDYQQAAVIQRMIQDLDFDIKFRLCPTVREKDGLAMSSRNQYLSSRDRERALVLSEALFGLRRALELGRGNFTKLKQQARRLLSKKTSRVQYLEIVDPQTLENLTQIQPKMVALAACYVGKTRLIDNVIIRTRKKSSRRRK